MDGQPGGGCQDPRYRHEHWCAACGTGRVFSIIRCRVVRGVPPCSECGEQRWMDEIDAFIAGVQGA
ncbi:hypothetical protein CLV92_10515 [Kineococcus xinjiangensis]|uniref:Uncharacterized protein n=1 Tax=Kineococcus xinjiangensis TaxID=512762 RepID=A0A2S6IP16_9ACTN|nr:hypothetical protein [Kineococcus xinjiangensis]PPK95921.1 hypothetical protein CLV92_10515 [Kineococcus xinjiangensis]